jgi:hypothetical protein
MNIIDVPLAVLRLQYRIARFPFQLIEQRVVAQMDQEAPARLLFERSFGGLDATVGHLLSDPELASRGAALVERSDALGRAAGLDATAVAKQKQADAELKAKRDKAF